VQQVVKARLTTLGKGLLNQGVYAKWKRRDTVRQPVQSGLGVNIPFAFAGND
jgi:hypothetical protein